MRKNRVLTYVFSLFTLLVNFSNAYAQYSANHRFGITGGLSTSQIKATTTSNLLWRYNVGLSFEQRFTPGIALASYLTYIKQGSSTPSTGLAGDDKVINELDYLSLPIMLRFSRGAKRFFLEAGGQVGYLLSGKGYFESGKSQYTPLIHTHKVDYGLTGGIGYRLSEHFILDGRYYYGMNTILTDYTAPDPATGSSTFYRVPKWYNRSYSLNLSYYF